MRTFEPDILLVIALRASLQMEQATRACGVYYIEIEVLTPRVVACYIFLEVKV